jgi:hypothetical protein
VTVRALLLAPPEGGGMEVGGAPKAFALGDRGS